MCWHAKKRVTNCAKSTHSRRICSSSSSIFVGGCSRCRHRCQLAAPDFKLGVAPYRAKSGQADCDFSVSAFETVADFQIAPVCGKQVSGKFAAIPNYRFRKSRQADDLQLFCEGLV